MAGKVKHAQRAHRSYNKNVDFSSFYHKARFKKTQKVQRKTLGQMLKEMFHPKVKP